MDTIIGRGGCVRYITLFEVPGGSRLIVINIIHEAIEIRVLITNGTFAAYNSILLSLRSFGIDVLSNMSTPVIWVDCSNQIQEWACNHSSWQSALDWC